MVQESHISVPSGLLWLLWGKHGNMHSTVEANGCKVLHTLVPHHHLCAGNHLIYLSSPRDKPEKASNFAHRPSSWFHCGSFKNSCLSYSKYPNGLVDELCAASGALPLILQESSKTEDSTSFSTHHIMSYSTLLPLNTAFHWHKPRKVPINQTSTEPSRICSFLRMGWLH